MRPSIAFILLLVFAATVLPLDQRVYAALNEPKAIITAPPAPKFTDAERQTELARRRQAVADAMKDNSLLVLLSADPRLYSNSVNYVYRQENNLYYLTNLKQNNATLVMLKQNGKVRELLFMPKRDPQFETWNGKMYSNEEAARISGLKTIAESKETNDFLEALKARKGFSAKTADFSYAEPPENVYLLKGNRIEFRKEHALSEQLSGSKVENALPIFARLRLVKSPYEIKLMRHAVDITTEAIMRSMAMVDRAKWEYEVQAEVEYTFRRRNADFWGYPSIVGCGENATTLHYQDPQGEVRHGELLLMDVGAEYDHYTADVTRTFPVNGKFTKEQADIYRIVYEAQEAAAKAVKTGATFGDVEDAADEVIKKGLHKLGLITAPDAKYQINYQGKTLEMPQFKFWFMHGLGHWLGMNVHDVGSYETPLKSGMIFTNEPGIYIREDALGYLIDTPANKEFIEKVRPAFEKYKRIGVRIEDDMLVTENGVEWMTKKLPRKLEEVEDFMARASKELPYTAMLRPGGNVFGIEYSGLLAALNNQSVFDAKHILSGLTLRRGWLKNGDRADFADRAHIDRYHSE